MSNFNAKTLPSQAQGKRPDPLEEGSYPARLVQIILLGTQTPAPFKGEQKPPRLTIRATYELLDEFMKDEEGNDLPDRPRWISEEFPFMSLRADLAKSTKRYYALDPEDKSDGDWSKLLTAPCIVTITKSQGKDGNIYNNVSAVSAMRPKEAAKAPELVNPTLIWDFYSPDIEVFKAFPEWLQTKIKEAVDFDGSDLQSALEGGQVVRSKVGSQEEKKPSKPLVDNSDEEEQEDW
jgi:hypothetical protein